MPIGKRMRVLLAPDADPNLLAAVLESLLDELSGINAATRELVRNNVIEKENPGALSVIEKLKSASCRAKGVPIGL